MSQPVALITGASRGIGAAIARNIQGLGYRCALVARSENKIKELSAELGEGHHAFPHDLSALETLPTLIETVISEMGRLDVLVNNAGSLSAGPIEQGDPLSWDAMMRLNVSALMALTTHASPSLRASDCGAVINICSIASREVIPGLGAYCASKHAALAFTQATFQDLREDGVKVCAISPGFVNTDMPGDTPADRDKMIPPEAVAETARFILTFPSLACPTEITIRPQRDPLKSG